MNIFFYTLGCKVNQYETEAMRECFKTYGHETVAESNIADVIVINSCTVTAESDRKTRQLLHKCRRNNPGAIIILTGCMVQAFPDESEALSDADIIVGNTDIEHIVTLAENFRACGERIIEISEHKPKERFNTPGIRTFAERTRAYMKIEDGCDRFCSYCIIPTARGRVRSRSLEDIKIEAQRLAENGFLEIVLTGINLSAYGKNESFNLCDAVEAVCSIDKIKRVRLGSLEPDHIDDKMLERFKAQEKFCPQFHLSLQSGCDETLKRMNRHYNSAFYMDLITRIRKMFPDASITTDIMVGFAGETEDEFNQSLEFAKKAGFAKAHIFMYSRRNGTAAYSLENQVVKSEKERRSRLMIETTLNTEKDFLKSQIGKITPVLFETSSSGFAEGFTPNYSKVLVKSKEHFTGQILNVKIISYSDDCCIGEILK